MKRKKQWSFLLSIVLLLTAVIGGTLAYMVVKTMSVENQFQSAQVSCEVLMEKADKTDVIKVQNTSNVHAYIRAAIIVNWVDRAGNVLGTAPVKAIDEKGGDYAWLSVEGAWVQDTNTGFYYYTSAVEPGEITSPLISNISVTATPPSDDYSLSIEVIAEAIQADGVTDDGGTPAYQDAWGITPLGN